MITKGRVLIFSELITFSKKNSLGSYRRASKKSVARTLKSDTVMWEEPVWFRNVLAMTQSSVLFE